METKPIYSGAAHEMSYLGNKLFRYENFSGRTWLGTKEIIYLLFRKETTWKWTSTKPFAFSKQKHAEGKTFRDEHSFTQIVNREVRKKHAEEVESYMISSLDEELK